MKNIKLTIEYDGTRYAGWQIQENHPTIQQELKTAVEKAVEEEINLIGAGRTDSGVHAYGQVANFRTKTSIPGDKAFYHINPHLPEDIVVVRSEEVPLSFHSRYDALTKTYHYVIINGPHMHPRHRHYAQWIDYALDLEAMREAGGFFLGEHDFTSFMAANAGDVSTIRSIDAIDIQKEGDVVEIQVKGRSFLRNMIRIMMGTLVDVGKGKIPPDKVATILEAKDRQMAGPTLSACGLYLMNIEYGEEQK